MTGEMKKKIALSVFLSLLIITMLSFSLTAARYSKDAESEGIYDGQIEYTLSDQVEIRNMDEFFNAVENGYTNVQISEEASDPFIITGDSPDVNSDLTIDLNGHVLQRNDREQFLNVTEGVRLTVIDSKGGGGFYNPVGSVLNIDGGTLTVAGGVFESGPRDGKLTFATSAVAAQRKSEYAAADGSGYRTAAGASTSGTQSLSVQVKNSGSYTAQTASMPVIIPYTEIVQDGEKERLRINGNMYFDGQTNPGYGGLVVSDTYLYYTVDDVNVLGATITADPASADFYYSYYADESTYAYAGAPSSAGETPPEGQMRITVYGYNRVKAAATDSQTHVGDSEAHGFSAVRLTDGNLYARGGYYLTYFGEQNTYSVYAEGGYMSVSGSETAFGAHGQGMCVSVSYDSADTSEEYLQFESGKFYSELGDTVRVSGGYIQIDNATFEKDASAAASSQDGGAAIHLRGGKLETSNVGFTITGSHVRGVYAEAEETGSGVAEEGISLTGATFSFNGEKDAFAEGGKDSGCTDNYGIYAESGTVEVEDFSLYMADSYGRGIYADGGDVSLAGTNDIFVQGANSAGILTYGGEVEVQGTFVCKVGIGGKDKTTLSSAAVSTEGGSIVLNAAATIDTYGLGITSRGNGTITVGGTLTLTSYYGTAVYMSGGSLTTSADSAVNITGTVNGGKEWVTAPGETGAANREIYNGVYIQGGSLVADGSFNVTHTGIENAEQSVEYADYVIRSHAVRVENQTGGNIYVVLRKGNIENKVGGGVYVAGGEVYLGSSSAAGSGDLTVTASGNETYDTPMQAVEGVDINNWQYRGSKTGGNAVQADGGNLTIYSGTYTAKQGNGIYVRDGEVTIAGGTFGGADNYEAASDDGMLAGAAASYSLRVHGGKTTVEGGTFDSASGSCAFFMGSASAENDKTTITGGSFRSERQTGISVYDGADVEIGTANGNNASVVVGGTAVGVALEEEKNTSMTLLIRSGTFYSPDGNAVWHASPNAKLTITGGEFRGSYSYSAAGAWQYRDGGDGGSGLFIKNNLTGGSISLSGGHFMGHAARESADYNGSSTWADTYWADGGAIGTTAGRSGWGTWVSYSYTGVTLQLTAILSSGYSAYANNSSRVDPDQYDGYISNTVSQHTDITIRQ